MFHEQHKLRTDESEEVNADTMTANLNCQGIFEKMMNLMFKRTNLNQDNTNPYANNIMDNNWENIFLKIQKTRRVKRLKNMFHLQMKLRNPSSYIHYLVLKNPLPPDLSPDDAISYMNGRFQFDGHQQIEIEEDTSSFEERCFDESHVESRDIKYYVIVTFIPVTGILIYCWLKSERPKFAKHLLNYMFGCFIILGSLLLIILI